MNLSWRPFSQSSSVKCSMTPPAAEPALLTMMSIRPSALAPCSMKFFASASFRRSAEMATTLRPVSLAMSFATASSGSLRRAQIATSTPSLVSANAMPLPMPSLPPVTSAVLPLSLRSIVSSHFLLRRLVCKPPAGFRRSKKLGQRRIECARLFGGNVMPAAWDHQEPGGRHGTLEKNAAIDAGLVFVPDDDEQRHGKFLQVGFHLPQRRPLKLEIEHRMRMTLGGMLRQHASELCIAAGILVL